MQDARPRGDDGVVQPIRSSEIPERDEAIGERGEWRNRRHRIRRRIGQRNARQSDDAFAEQRLSAGRRQHRIREEGIHRGQTGRIAVPQQVFHLHRRRLACEHQEAAAGGMAGEVHQHVDAVAPDHLSDCRIVLPDNAAPMLGQRTEPFGDGVLGGDRGITEQLDT